MKYTIDIHPLLKEVTFEADDSFGESLISGEFASYRIKLEPDDLARVEEFVKEHGDNIQAGEFDFVGQCNGYAMNLTYCHYIKPEEKISVFINTYRIYGTYGPIQYFEKDKVNVWMRRSVYDKLKENGELSKYIF